jgi:hypothetical protein
MAFEFAGFTNGGGTENLASEKRLSALSGYAMYNGQALTITGGCLCYAQSAQKVYAISNISAASSVVTAGYHPEVFPVNNKQIWKTGLGSAITAAFLPGTRTNFATSVELGTSVAGDEATGSAMYVYAVVTASDPPHRRHM